MYRSTVPLRSISRLMSGTSTKHCSGLFCGGQAYIDQGHGLRLHVFFGQHQQVCFQFSLLCFCQMWPCNSCRTHIEMLQRGATRTSSYALSPHRNGWWVVCWLHPLILLRYSRPQGRYKYFGPSQTVIFLGQRVVLFWRLAPGRVPIADCWIGWDGWCWRTLRSLGPGGRPNSTGCIQERCHVDSVWEQLKTWFGKEK